MILGHGNNDNIHRLVVVVLCSLAGIEEAMVEDEGDHQNNADNADGGANEPM